MTLYVSYRNIIPGIISRFRNLKNVLSVRLHLESRMIELEELVAEVAVAIDDVASLFGPIVAKPDGQ